MTKANPASLLRLCMAWIGEGLHMYLVQELLDHGLDLVEPNIHVMDQWPRACDPNWISEEITPDPFFVEIFARLVRVFPGMFSSCRTAIRLRDSSISLTAPDSGNTNSLHEAVLRKDIA